MTVQSMVTRLVKFDTKSSDSSWQLSGSGTSSGLPYFRCAGPTGSPEALYMADNLAFDIDDLYYVEFLARIGNWDSSARAYLGLISTWNATPSSIAHKAWFYLGSNSFANGVASIEFQTDDAVNDTGLQDTGFTIAPDTWKRFRIHLKTGIQSRSVPPDVGTSSQSKGGKGSIRYSITDSHIGYQRTSMPPPVNFDMSDYSGGLQVFMQCNSGTAPEIHVEEVCLQYRAAR